MPSRCLAALASCTLVHALHQVQGPVLGTSTTGVTVEWFNDSTCTIPSGHYGSHKTIFHKETGSKCVPWEYFRLGEPGSGLKYLQLDANKDLKMYNTVGCTGMAVHTFEPYWVGLLRCPSNTCVADGTVYRKVSGTGFDFDPDNDVSPPCQSAKAAGPSVQDVMAAGDTVLAALGPFVGHSGATAVRLGDQPNEIWGDDKARTLHVNILNKGKTQALGWGLGGGDMEDKSKLLFGGAYRGYDRGSGGPEIPEQQAYLGYVGTDDHMAEGVLARPGKEEGVDFGKLKVMTSEGRVTQQQIQDAIGALLKQKK